jgi:serine/threonine protein kinase
MNKDGLEDKKNRTFIDKALGKGSFGTVYQGKYVDLNGFERNVAIKKVFQDKRYKNRELEIMLQLKHPNIVELFHNYTTTGDKDDEVYLNLVMEFVQDTGYKVAKTYSKSGEVMPNILVKVYAYQLLRAVAFMHGMNICHRDIKPQNLLIDPTTHRLVVCDLGSAKRLVKGEPNVTYICSRYYRAPELIFGCTEYTTAIDIWSVSCVIAEFIKGKPLFAGDSGIDQLVEIIRLLGTPTKAQIKDMNPYFEAYKFPHVKVKSWEQVFDTCDLLTLDFLKSLICYSPFSRPTAIQALLHPFFDELKLEDSKLPNGNDLPLLFNWTEEELKTYPSQIKEIDPKKT